MVRKVGTPIKSQQHLEQLLQGTGIDYRRLVIDMGTPAVRALMAADWPGAQWSERRKVAAAYAYVRSFLQRFVDLGVEEILVSDREWWWALRQPQAISVLKDEHFWWQQQAWWPWRGH